MNKYLEKIASMEKSALTRLVKEMIKRRGAGLPVSEAGFTELAHRGASRSLLQYAKGIKRRDNKFMKQLGVKLSPTDSTKRLSPEGKRAFFVSASKYGTFRSKNPITAQSNYNAVTKEIGTGKTNIQPSKGLIRSHEVHEALESKLTGWQKGIDEAAKKIPKSKLRDLSFKDSDKIQMSGWKSRINTNPEYVRSRDGHISTAVLGRESNDVRTNPFAHTLISHVDDHRRFGGNESLKLLDATHKQYGVDKFTNKDLEKLRKVE